MFVSMQLDPAAAATSQANREEVDARSVFVGNVRPLSLTYFICLLLHSSPYTVLVLFAFFLKFSFWGLDRAGSTVMPQYDVFSHSNVVGEGLLCCSSCCRLIEEISLSFSYLCSLWLLIDRYFSIMEVNICICIIRVKFPAFSYKSL